MFLPLLVCEHLTERYAREVGLSTKRILALEDYTEAPQS
jgi:hypothetical protein